MSDDHRQQASSMTLRLDQALADELGIVAQVRDAPVAVVIRAAIAEYIEATKADPGFQDELRKRIEREQRMQK